MSMIPHVIKQTHRGDRKYSIFTYLAVPLLFVALLAVFIVPRFTGE